VQFISISDADDFSHDGDNYLNDNTLPVL
jgi:hypothetical protein